MPSDKLRSDHQTNSESSFGQKPIPKAGKRNYRVMKRGNSREGKSHFNESIPTRPRSCPGIEEFLPVFTKEGAHARPFEDWSRGVECRLPEKELGQVIGGFTEELTGKIPRGVRSATPRDAPTRRRHRSWT